MTFSLCRFSLARFFTFLFIFLLTWSFTPAALDWARMQHRTSLQAIITRVAPHFTKVPIYNNNNNNNITEITESYYNIWRYYDFNADAYRQPRYAAIPAIPILYIHGNAGSFKDMRSLGRFVGEANINQRIQRVKKFEENVKRVIFKMYKSEGKEMPKEGDEIPKEIQQKAEEIVISETPILGTELFGADFLDESSTQSGIIMMKEAIFLNYSVHKLLEGLYNHYKEVLDFPKTNLRKTIKKEEKKQYFELTPVKEAEDDYINSICVKQKRNQQEALSICSKAKEQIHIFSSIERIRLEVKRIQKEGIWIWTESLGGTVGVMAALFAPHLYAGLIMAGPPLRYPPLLFDGSCVNFQKAVHDSTIISYAYNNISHLNWSTILRNKRPLEILENLKNIPSEEFAARMSRVSMVVIHGGALEDIVPPRSSMIMRSTGRNKLSNDYQKFKKNNNILNNYFHSGRRDVSSEELRGCGTALTHRGLVYALQLVDVAADSLVQASLTSKAGELIGVESTIPTSRERLFPMVVESLPPLLYKERMEEYLFISSLRKIEENNNNNNVYRKENNSYGLRDMTKICVDGKYLINVQDIPKEEDSNSDSWSPLYLFIGVTTYDPDEVNFPELILISENNKNESKFYKEEKDIVSRIATKLHLPTRRRDGDPIIGSVLKTALSFKVLLKNPIKSSKLVRPRFCFLINKSKVSKNHFSFVQYDKIDPLHKTGNLDMHNKTLNLQMSGSMSVEKYGKFIIIRNLDSMTMETNMVLSVNNKKVFPHIICGSFRSFRLAFRGNEEVAIDEPESQEQYFYGPYDKQRNKFYYSWRPVHTTPFNLTNIYIVYILSSDEKPNILFEDLERYQSPELREYKYWNWRFKRWTMRWMAVLSTYSVSGKFAGCYALLFLTLYILFCTKLEKNRIEGKRLRNLFGLSPILMILILSLIIENFGCILASKTLSVCLQEDPPIRTDEEFTSMMNIKEKLMLIFLYALPPNYNSCKYSWIRMQTIVPSDVQIDHMMHVICAFCFFVILILIEFGIYCLMWPISFILKFPLKRFIHNKLSICILTIIWSIPIIIHLTIPYIHISITTTIACLLSFGMIWCIPREVIIIGKPPYRWYCFLLTMMMHFTSHFEGLVFAVRNYFIVPHIVLKDKERFEPIPEHLFAFIFVQCALAVVYGTVYFTLRHHASIINSAFDKKNEDNNDKENKKKKIKNNNNNLNYVLGDINRQYKKIRNLSKCGSFIVFFFSIWVSIISTRRPLEGTVALAGVCVTATYMIFILLGIW